MTKRTFGQLQPILFEVRPAETIEIGPVVGIQHQRPLDQIDRLVEPLAAFRQHVPEVVQRGGVLRVPVERAPKRPLSLAISLPTLEYGAELEDDEDVFRKPDLSRL